MEDKTINARDKAFSIYPTKLWKVRSVKPYPDAHNHIFLGEVIQETSRYVVMKCITFHFGKKVDASINNKVITGMLRIRRIPWYQIEVIHDIKEDFNYSNAKLTVDEENTVVLRDGKYDCIITKRIDRIK